MSLPNNIITYRQKKNLLKSEVAKLIGHNSASQIRRWEENQELPNLIDTIRLSITLDCPVEVLFFEHFHTIREDIRQKRKKMNFRVPQDYSQESQYFPSIHKYISEGKNYN